MGVTVGVGVGNAQVVASSLAEVLNQADSLPKASLAFTRP
jgi:hypothetical protein